MSVEHYIDYIHSNARAGHDSFVEKVPQPFSRQADDVKTIALYLPQFHPFPENDLNWEKGFVEWMRVSRTVPQFTGHFQPRMPIEYGYYDLRQPTIFEQQIALAKHYGIYGFCFYYYWFSGKRLMDGPIKDYLNRQDLDLPFMFCWANESWIRNWDGVTGEVLQEQNLTASDPELFYRDIEPFILDERYIRIDNKPVIMIYRPDYWPQQSTQQMIDTWQELAIKSGLDGLTIIGGKTGVFAPDDLSDYRLDRLVEFPPHQFNLAEMDLSDRYVYPEFQGNVYDLDNYVDGLADSIDAHAGLIKALFPSWDNSARVVNGGTIFHTDNPIATYKNWLEKLLEVTYANNAAENRYLFINAWNEWGEGAHLEPDRRYGYGFLDATRTVIESLR